MTDHIVTDADLDQFEQLLYRRVGLLIEQQESLVKALRDARAFIRIERDPDYLRWVLKQPDVNRAGENREFIQRCLRAQGELE
jgi:hypothetical protein